MAKKNYTKAGAKRAMQAALTKVLKVHQDGHMSDQMFLKIRAQLKQVHDRIK